MKNRERGSGKVVVIAFLYAWFILIYILWSIESDELFNDIRTGGGGGK